MKQLLIGCGGKRTKQIYLTGNAEWTHLVTLDNNALHQPNVLHDLNVFPLPFEDNAFNELHAYEVLEHLGHQGDYHAFFALFSEFWRILEPNGHLFATVPSLKSPWAWGDPSHTRVIPPQTLVFLDQEEYTKQVGVTAMSDFRHLYQGDFKTVATQDDDMTHAFILQAIKPSRIQLS